MTAVHDNKQFAPLSRQTTIVRSHRILLIEDHPVVSRGLCALINNEQDLRVCGIAEDYKSAISLADACKADLIVLEIGLKDRNGLELIEDIKTRHPEQRVLIFSLQDESIYAHRALRAGASGYVMKHETLEALLAAIRKVLDGEVYLSSSMEKQMMQRLFGHKPEAMCDLLECLSDREMEVLRLLGQAKGTGEIAAELHLSAATVETHRQHVKKQFESRQAPSRQLEQSRMQIRGFALSIRGLPKPKLQWQNESRAVSRQLRRRPVGRKTLRSKPSVI